MPGRLLRKFETNKVFTENEAWMLFRLAAIGEACGWGLLVAGILAEKYTGSHIPVFLAGRMHGMLFLLYGLAAAGLYPNLRWSRWRALVALAASVPPFGSLLFEQWASHSRHTKQFKLYSRCTLLALLGNKI